MGKFEVKTPRTPEGAERRASKTFKKALEKMQEQDLIDENGQIIGNTLNDKDEGIRIAIVPCYSKEGIAMDDLAILNVEEYSSSSDQKRQLPEAKTTFLFDSRGNICEMCYSDARKFQEYENPVYEIYDDKRLDKSIVEKFEEANTPINASFLDSVALSNNFTEYFPEVIQDDILEVAYPTMLKAYICDRLQGLVEESELDDVDELDVDSLLEVSDRIAELDDDQLAQLAEEDENSL